MSHGSLPEIIVAAVSDMSGWEFVAAGFGLGYIILAARESRWCWPLAFVSTLIYTMLFWEGQLPMQAILNVYYMGMAGYGFWLWQQQSTAGDEVSIQRWAIKKHLAFLAIGAVLTIAVGNYLTLTDASRFPYLDAGVAMFSVMAMWLMAQKVLENWLYWIVVDIAAIVLYLETGYYATVGLFTVYIILAVVGWMQWRRKIRPA